MFSIAHIAIRPYCKLPPFQIHPHSKFTHVTICPYFQFPHVEGLIAISLYTCVFWTFTNIHVNTQKKRHGLGMRAFACVVGANWNSPILQFIHIANYLHSKFAPISNSPPFQIPPLQIAPIANCPHSKLPPLQIALGIKNSKKVFYYKNKFVSLPPWKKYMSCNTHSWLHSVLGIVLSWRLCLFVYIL